MTIQEENEFLKNQVKNRDKLLEEANGLIKQFYPATSVPTKGDIPPGCIIKLRRGSWRVEDNATGKKINVGENVKKLRRLKGKQRKL